jgi:glycosyltransferase involved in cell wall biosynthesis
MKVFFVHSGSETFVKIDHDLLISMFEVLDFHALRKFPYKIAEYWNGVREADVVFCWFASWNCFWALLLAKIFNKPSLMVIGGYDVANLPVADYGHQRGGLKKWIGRWAMKLTDILIPISHFSQQEAEINAGINANHMKMIYIGVPDAFAAMPKMVKERMALTVGNVEWHNLKRKGLEPFVYAAAHLPDVKFVVVGAWVDNSIEYLRSIASDNVTFTGQISKEELLEYYRRASVYVQASLHEGFGLSVAEAMLAGCIPVTTRAGSLPEVVGECGIYCDLPEQSVVAKRVEEALNSSFSSRGKARERILSQFPLNKRRYMLEKTIQLAFNGLNEN